MGEVRVLETDGFRLYAGLVHQGAMYANHINEWVRAGLDGLTVTSHVSHKRYLYAVAGLPDGERHIGIYHGSKVRLLLYRKLRTTWGAVKTK